MLQYYLGSLAIRINGGEYVFRDNNNGEIYNDSGMLSQRGKINYITGDIDIEFVSADTVVEDIQVDYTKNEANIVSYTNLNTEEFTFDASSMEAADAEVMY